MPDAPYKPKKIIIQTADLVRPLVVPLLAGGVGYWLARDKIPQKVSKKIKGIT